MTQSIQSRIIPTLMRAMRLKREASPNEITPIAAPAKPPANLHKQFNISSRTVHGHNVWTIAPKHASSSQHVLYVHGGAYIYNFNSVHWQFIAKLIQRTGCTVIAPDYPLGPKFQAVHTVPMMLEVYRDLIGAVGAKNTVVMGDSAGGGLALVLAQQLRTANLEQPSKLILLSPWLDVSMTNAGIPAVDALDPILSISGLRHAAKQYAGDLSLTDPLVSPLYGTLEGVAPMTLFIGTHDVLWPDCQRFKTQAETQGIQIAYHEAERMVHVFMLLPMPEANRVMDEIVKVLERRDKIS